MNQDAKPSAGRSADPANRALRLALLWRGNPDAPDPFSRHRTRLEPLTEALTQAGVTVEPVLYADEATDTVRDQLLRCDGVMVWVNPLADGQDRSRLDPMLRQVACSGVWVSADPDVIRAMGTKEVLFRTRSMSWDADTHLYETFEVFQKRFPSRLEAGRPRILKPQRGNDGQGVWKVELQHQAAPHHPETPDHWSITTLLVVQAAADDGIEAVPMPALIERCRPYFSDGGCLIDQAFQPRVGEGMIRCYLSQDQVVGWSEQWPRRETAAAGRPALGMASAKTMHEPSAAPFQRLRQMMEEAWLPSMLGILDLAPAALPAIWDADFLLGPPDAAGQDTYVLCEINVSSVLPFPDTAAGGVARTVSNCLKAARQARCRSRLPSDLF
ncbi:Cj0069 family protein [Paeniroseomonas aquatica]|uniref:Cj0069 family protein n=1 Tax=Paeniroseomonas aquatica TaxID=373043 RepID=A0ABT8A476_9PROT|nr:Cj0069 family protein [Paeniroseomonas aquatica]MDN3564359.1 Cj0069 family protein [Paeniroseomonas aquatica]